MQEEDTIEHVIEDIITTMTSGTGLHHTIQHENTIEDTNVMCRFYIL
jgi:hypothetical protein